MYIQSILDVWDLHILFEYASLTILPVFPILFLRICTCIIFKPVYQLYIVAQKMYTNVYGLYPMYVFIAYFRISSKIGVSVR